MTSPPSPAPARPLKVVVSGPPGAGTTTLISTVSQLAVASTKRRVADDAPTAIVPTAVAMDFGRFAVDGDLVLHLFGSAGPPHPSVRSFLDDGLLGRILLVDAGRDGARAEADAEAQVEAILGWFREAPEVPYVVGVTRAWSKPDAAVGRMRERLALPEEVAVLAVDVRQAGSARSLLLALLHGVLARVEATESEAVST